MKRVWITRSQPGAAATAARVQSLGWTPLVAPLIEIRPCGGPVDLAGVGALAFTSAAGVRVFAALSAERALPVFAVGEATAAVAAEVGFAEVFSADGDVAALSALIGARRGSFAGDVLNPGAKERAGALTGARTLTVYESHPATLPTDFAIAGLDAVLLHSPRAARLAADLFRGALEPAMAAVCLSPAVAAPLAGLGLEVRIAVAPNEAALLRRLAAE